MKRAASSRPQLRALALRTLVALLLACCGAPQEGPPRLRGDFPADLPRPAHDLAEIEIGGRKVTVELAETPEQRAYGLMFVSELPADQGMLFLYPSPRPLGFWMRNTLIPLDIAFIAEMDGECRIINLHHRMEPFRETPSYDSAGACRLALELPAGFLERHGVRRGDLISIPAPVLGRNAVEDGLLRRNLPRRIGPGAAAGG